MSEPQTPAVAKLSATILLLRDGTAGLEVFMVERHHQIDFATGALVFPGGKVDAGDTEGRLLERCRGLAGRDAKGARARVAAIRETFEESGVLLARPRGGEALIEAERLRVIEERFRSAVHSGDATMLELVESEDLELAGDLLVPFAHWITPEFMRKRFDTHFFLAAAPDDQLALHDGVESVDSLWTTVDDALRAGREGRRTVIFPTRMNLQKLGQAASVDEAMSRARSDRIVTVLPRIEKTAEGGSQIRLPDDAGYAISVATIEDIMS